MNLTETSLKNPSGVAVAVAIVLAFGLFSLLKLPVQLFPDIERPQISVQTGWRAASPRPKRCMSRAAAPSASPTCASSGSRSATTTSGRWLRRER